MNRVPVESTLLLEAGYDEDKSIVEVVFRSGETWQYHKVQPHKWAQMMAAKRPGQYFVTKIKTKDHPAFRVGTGEKKTPVAQEPLTVVTPVYLALLQSKKRLKDGVSPFLYTLWSYCGKEPTGKQPRYSAALRVLIEAGNGTISQDNLERAIQLAKEQRV